MVECCRHAEEAEYMHKERKMKTIILVIAAMLMSITMVAAQTVTERVDVQDEKAPAYTIYAQGLPGGVEVWALNYSTPTPMYRIGALGNTSFGKVGGYFATKDGESWINPRVVLTGKFAGGNAKLIIDEFEPISSDAKRMVTLSDAYILYPIGDRISLGPGANGSWVDDGKHWLKGDIVLTAKIDKSDSVFLRWNCIGESAPDSVRAEWCHRF